MMATLLKRWLSDTIETPFSVGVTSALMGGLWALLLRHHMREARRAVTGTPRPRGLAPDPLVVLSDDA